MSLTITVPAPINRATGQPLERFKIRVTGPNIDITSYVAIGPILLDSLDQPVTVSVKTPEWKEKFWNWLELQGSDGWVDPWFYY